MQILKRIFVIFGVAFLLAGDVSCSDTKNEKDGRIFESAINKTLEAIKGIFKEGIESVGIPPLDPLNIGNVFFPVFVKEIVYVDVEASEVSVSGVSDFYATHLKFSLLKNRLDYAVLVPKVVVDGLYGLNGTLVQFIPAFGNGSFGAEITNLELSGHLAFKFISSKITINDFKLVISLDDLQFSLTGLMDNEEFTQSLINNLNEYVGPMINQYKEEISQIISPILKYTINSILQFILYG